MTELSGIKGRKQRLEIALGMIKAANPIGFVQAVNLLSFNLGVTYEKAREYVDVLIGAGYVIKDKATLSITKKKKD